MAVSLDAAAIARQSATLNALGPHPFGSPRNQAAAQFVAAKLQEAGLAQTTVEEFAFDGVTGTNVVATVQGRSDRLLIIATHHDSKKDALDVSARSRSLALLIEIGRQAALLRPAKTWILASFDGGESAGEGMAHYLESLGRNLGLVDGVMILEASSAQTTPNGPALIAPACPGGPQNRARSIAGRDLVEAAISGVPASAVFFFDDPGISLLTQPFIRAFKTDCDPVAARVLASGLGVIQAREVSYSRGFLAASNAASSDLPASRDTAAAELGDVAFAAIQGIDAATPSQPQSDSWLVVGSRVLPGWLLFVIGIATLVPGLIALRGEKLRLALRVVQAALFIAALYAEPEIALFAGLLPNLLPPSLSGKFLAPTLIPFALLLTAGGLGLVRGQVTGSWLSVWVWLGLILSLALLYATMARGKKSPARSRAKKK